MSPRAGASLTLLSVPPKTKLLILWLGRDEVRAVPWAILAVGFAVIIGLGVLGGPLGFFASAIAGGIFALVLNAWYQWRHPV